MLAYVVVFMKHSAGLQPKSKLDAKVINTLLLFVSNTSYNNNNNNFIVQFIEWQYILHVGGCIKTQYLSQVGI